MKIKDLIRGNWLSDPHNSWRADVEVPDKIRENRRKFWEEEGGTVATDQFDESDGKKEIVVNRY